jgi:hypothetical protein
MVRGHRSVVSHDRDPAGTPVRHSSVEGEMRWDLVDCRRTHLATIRSLRAVVAVERVEVGLLAVGAVRLGLGTGCGGLLAAALPDRAIPHPRSLVLGLSRCNSSARS